MSRRPAAPGRPPLTRPAGRRRRRGRRPRRRRRRRSSRSPAYSAGHAVDHPSHRGARAAGRHRPGGVCARPALAPGQRCALFLRAAPRSPAGGAGAGGVLRDGGRRPPDTRRSESLRVRAHDTLPALLRDETYADGRGRTGGRVSQATCLALRASEESCTLGRRPVAATTTTPAARHASGRRWSTRPAQACAVPSWRWATRRECAQRREAGRSDCQFGSAGPMGAEAGTWRGRWRSARRAPPWDGRSP